MAQTDETFILLKTGANSLSDVTVLDLSNIGLGELDPDLMQKLENLESLNLSSNQLSKIPLTIELPKLKKLDVSQNALTSLDFISQFPALTEIQIDGNAMDPSEKYIAAMMNSTLQQIDKTKVSNLTATINSLRQKIEPEVRDVYKTSFEQQNGSGDGDFGNLINEMSAKVCERKLQGPSHLKKFKEFLAKKLTMELIDELRCSEPSSKRQKVSDSPTPTGKATKGGASKKKVASRLPQGEDYDPKHFLRCHFCDREALRKGHRQDDPTDATTKIWCCQFEPNPSAPEETTNVIATCGGDTVSLIDCSTGRLLKRYQQTREQFYALAWTTLKINGKQTNILAVGGHNGHIKLLNPEQLLCYKQLGTGRPNRACHLYYLSCLVFHPKNKTWLFTGASDTTVTLWDIGVPQGEKYETKAQVLSILSVTEGSGILNLVFHDNYLLTGCETSCFGFRIQEDNLKQKNREPDFELVLPKGNVAQVDGLVKVGKDLIASKCAKDKNIYLWKLSAHLNKATSDQRKVETLAALEWAETNVDYINIGSTNGMLVSGDDRGNIWLYILDEIAKSPSKHDSSLKPSRILPWPNCELDEREGSQKMTDILDLPSEIVVNCTAISSSRQYVVAGTDNNLVCIWERCK